MLSSNGCGVFPGKVRRGDLTRLASIVPPAGKIFPIGERALSRWERPVAELRNEQDCHAR